MPGDVLRRPFYGIPDKAAVDIVLSAAAAWGRDVGCEHPHLTRPGPRGGHNGPFRATDGAWQQWKALEAGREPHPCPRTSWPTSAPGQRERPQPARESADVDTAHTDGSGGSGHWPGGAGDPGAPNGQLHSLVQAVPGRLYRRVLCRPQQEQPANPRARNHPEQKGPEQSTARGRAAPRPPRGRGQVRGPSRWKAVPSLAQAPTLRVWGSQTLAWPLTRARLPLACHLQLPWLL